MKYFENKVVAGILVTMLIVPVGLTAGLSPSTSRNLDSWGTSPSAKEGELPWLLVTDGWVYVVGHSPLVSATTTTAGAEA